LWKKGELRPTGLRLSILKWQVKKKGEITQVVISFAIAEGRSVNRKTCRALAELSLEHREMT